MPVAFSGPSFEPAQDKYRRSAFNKSGGHYNVFGSTSKETAIEFLRQIFPSGEANELNFCLFSTSGVHGNYTTLEEIESTAKKYGWSKDFGEDEDVPDDFHFYDVTFLLVQPRIVGMTYGNALVRNDEEVAFLKKLRASSWKAVQTIGAAR